jgi:hypothetical protein
MQLQIRNQFECVRSRAGSFDNRSAPASFPGSLNPRFAHSQRQFPQPRNSSLAPTTSTAPREETLEFDTPGFEAPGIYSQGFDAQGSDNPTGHNLPLVSGGRRPPAAAFAQPSCGFCSPKWRIERATTHSDEKWSEAELLGKM